MDQEVIIKNLINNFSIPNLKSFLLLKGFDVLDRRVMISNIEFQKFKNVEEILQVGEKNLEYQKLLVFAIKLSDLNERSSKKRQYQIAKKLLILFQIDAGLFFFYNDQRMFRFSFVYSVPFYSRIEYSHYKRHTYFISPGKPSKTFYENMLKCSFSSLDEIKKAFSVYPLTKQFFTEIQNWYAWALRLSKQNIVYFPGGKMEENLIRLITRLIFVWFLKEKGLVSENIFDSGFLTKVVKDFPNGDSYYNVILQNLFFATLNNEIEKRKFAENSDLLNGVKNLYRYQDRLLISSQDFINIFKHVPFINGGLFLCLDEDEEYIDGFSMNEKKRAVLPDYLFFGDYREEDLSEFYGEKKILKVRGLINIFKDYNFTVDESSPVDVEVSLDPELLGNVFENLLASYNPETSTTARKSTGSYYTPKEIVDLMVDESLVEYFKDRTGIEERKLVKLLSYSDEDVDLSEEERRAIVKGVDSLKVLDPAVGSGAFPVGMLHKLVHLLNKVDPDNSLWFDVQLEKAREDIRVVSELCNEREKIDIDQDIKEIEKDFDELLNYPDYSRKLYVIQNCLYGVDIQPIAIQICKLRFFLSLLIDQKVDFTRPNCGIRPLPHLETKFVAANTLIRLESMGTLKFTSEEIRKLREELKLIYKKHFSIKTTTQKKRLQEKAKQIRERMKSLLIRTVINNEEIERIVNFDIFAQHQQATEWFDPFWMFAIDRKFDVVIGNPPYVRQEKIRHIKDILRKQKYKVFDSKADIYVYFFERGINLLEDRGILAFISSNKWMRASYGAKLRKLLKEENEIVKIIDFRGYPVFEQSVDTCIVILKKKMAEEEHKFYFVNVPSDLKDHSDAIRYVYQNQNSMLQKDISTDILVLEDRRILGIKEKIERIGKPLKDWNVKIYRGVITGFNQAFIIDSQTKEKILENCRTREERERTEKIIKPVLQGRDIKRYYYEWNGLWLIVIPAGWTNKNREKHEPEEFFKNSFHSIYSYLKTFEDYKSKGKGLYNRDDQGDYWWELRHCDYYPEFEKEKIVWQRVTQYPKFCIVIPGIYCEATTHFITGSDLYYLLGIFNSKFFHFAFYKFYMGGGIDGEIKGDFISRFPIPEITQENKPLTIRIQELACKIANLKQSNHMFNTQDLEMQIDDLVFKLYYLNDEEQKIVSDSVLNNTK